VLVFFLFVSGADIVKQRAEDHATRVSKRAGAVHATTLPAAQAPTPGGLTPGEFAHNLPRLADQFQQIDTDGSGRVTTEELQNYLSRTAPEKNQ
jgi:hypothetical protein